MKKILRTIIGITFLCTLSFLVILNFTASPAKADYCTTIFTDLDNWGKSSPQHVLSVRIVSLVGDGSYASYLEGSYGNLINLNYSLNVGVGFGPGFQTVNNIEGYFSNDRYGPPAVPGQINLDSADYPFAVTPNTINKHDGGLGADISIATSPGLVYILNDTLSTVQCSGNLIYGTTSPLNIPGIINSPIKAYAVYFEKNEISPPPK